MDGFIDPPLAIVTISKPSEHYFFLSNILIATLFKLVLLIYFGSERLYYISYVPCLFKMLAIRGLQKCITFLAINKVFSQSLLRHSFTHVHQVGFALLSSVSLTSNQSCEYHFSKPLFLVNMP